MTERNHFDGQIYADLFQSEKQSLPNAAVNWMADLRQSSLNEFIEVGIPGPKVEEWKYTNLSNLKNGSYGIASKTENNVDEIIAEVSFDTLSAIKVVFVDGHYQETLSNLDKIDGLEVSNLADFITNNADQARELLSDTENETGLGKLNLAMMTDGYVISIDENLRLAKPIEINHIATNHSSSKALRTRNFINAAAGCEVAIIESFIGQDYVDYWRQSFSKISLKEKASVEIYQFQREGNTAIHMGDTDVSLAADANFRHYSLNLGGKISRTEIKPTLTGLHGNVELRGAFMGRNDNAHDVMTHMKHMVPECESDQIYRGVLDKSGKSAFQGKVYVAKDAQLTNADQSNKNLILDRSAEANSKPELLIYADDVKCSHGATVGELDQEALFYLKSRGLDHKQAKALLVEAFVNEVFEEITIDTVRERYLELAGTWLEEGA